MKYPGQYTINFANLEEGEHLFEYQVGKDFFSFFDNSELKEADLTMTVQLIKQPELLLFNISFHGTVNIICDRCMEYFDLPLEGESNFIVKLNNNMEKEKEEDNMIYIAENENSFNIAQHVYESIHLSLPYKRVHQKLEDCNQKTIEYIDTTNKKDNNDPRWDELKKLIKNN